MVDTVERWSKTRADQPIDLGELADKNVRLLNPLAAPDFYFEIYDKAAAEVSIKDPATSEEAVYELDRNINDPDSGFHAKVMVNHDASHAVLVFKGMDMPFRDEGAGALAGAPQDIARIDNAQVFGCMSDQIIAAESAYLELLQDDSIKSIEIVGYSIGTMPANYMSSVYGASSTNIADLGVPGTGWGSSAQGWLNETFDTCSHGMFPGAHGEFEQNLENNVFGLKMQLDAMGGFIGGVGNEYGEKIVLDVGSLPDVKGIFHVPDMYAKAAREGHDAPETTTTQTLEGDNWKPFN